MSPPYYVFGNLSVLSIYSEVLEQPYLFVLIFSMGLGLAGMMAGTKMGSSKLAKSLSSKSEKLEKELLGTLWPDWDLCRSMPRTSGSTPANFTKTNNFLQKIQKHQFLQNEWKKYSKNIWKNYQLWRVLHFQIPNLHSNWHTQALFNSNLY